jgi:hypothetical protein
MFEIGSSLREARLRQGLDFPEIEQTIKVRGKYLRALEDEQFDLLPAQTYVKGFLRSYAEYLGLDGQLYVDEYNSRYVIGEGDDLPARATRQRPSRRAKPPRVQNRVVLLTLLGIAVVTALVIAAWKSGGSNKQSIYGLSTQQQNTPGAVTRRRTHARGPLRLVVRAVTGSSWIRVQRDPPRGALLYQNWLDIGRARRFSGRWLRLEARDPSALVLTLNGRRVHFPAGAKLVTVTANGLKPAHG